MFVDMRWEVAQSVLDPEETGRWSPPWTAPLEASSGEDLDEFDDFDDDDFDDEFDDDFEEDVDDDFASELEDEEDEEEADFED